MNIIENTVNTKVTAWCAPSSNVDYLKEVWI